MGKKSERMILITGGAGYVGSHANKYLHQNGYETVVFDNLIRGHREFVKWGKFVQGDLANIDQLRRCFSENAIDAVMHFAGFAYVGESVTDPLRYYENNVANTLKLLNVMREFGVNRFIFSSTCSTYGNPERLPLTEDHPQRPVNPYGRTKLMVEEILKDFEIAYGIRHVNLRYFNAAGADPDSDIGERHNPETHLIPLILEAACDAEKELMIFGTDYDTPDGTCIRDYIHVTDLADAHLRALKYLNNGGPSDSFNLGNGNGFSVREVIRTAEEITGRKINAVPWQRREGDPAVLIGSSEKAKSILGWNPTYNRLPTIIETAWNWLNIKRGPARFSE
jgi:UDP-glucose 4-epimerase